MDGILVLAKPPGPTSHDMVALVRRITSTRRVGHGGTLDPFASGVLPIFLGRATRLVEYHAGDTKTYRATVCFGASSTTDDLEGELTPLEGPAPDRATVEGALAAFRGSITQVPPAYSAIKVAGRRAYALARAGRKPELPPRDVMIHRLELVDWDGSDSHRPIAVLDVECSAGTYIRAIARDLGTAVGSAAYLGALARTASGPFRIEEAISLEALRGAAAAGADALGRLLLPKDSGLEQVPRLTLGEDDVLAIVRGQFVHLPAAAPDSPEGLFRLTDADGRLIAIARIRGGRLAPDKVFVDLPASSPPGSLPAVEEPQEEIASSDAELEAELAAERDASADVDPDPVTPDDI